MLGKKAHQVADVRRPFLLPRVKARRLKLLALFSSVGVFGLVLPEDWWL